MHIENNSNDIRNHPILQDSKVGLWGHSESWLIFSSQKLMKLPVHTEDFIILGFYADILDSQVPIKISRSLNFNLNQVHQLLTWENPSRLTMSSKSLEDWIVPDTIGIGVNMLSILNQSVSFINFWLEKINQDWTNTVSFINFWLEKVHQDSLCPQSPTLESWRTGWFLIPLELVSIC